MKDVKIPCALFKENREGGNKSVTVKVTCGNVEEENKYGRSEQERMCKICKKDIGTLKHLVVDCTGGKNTTPVWKRF